MPLFSVFGTQGAYAQQSVPFVGAPTVQAIGATSLKVTWDVNIGVNGYEIHVFKEPLKKSPPQALMS